MTKLKLSGSIMPKGWDVFAPAELIDAGLVADATNFIKALEAVADGDECEVYLSTPGGDCFMGAEIVIAARAAAARCKSFKVEVGAEACSMGANFVAAIKASGGTVAVHSNSQIMFHSCYAEAEGGPQHLEDRAELLRGVNGAVMDDLAKVGITDCRAWFAEAREKWIDAKGAVEMGLADEVIEAAAAKADASDAMKSRLAAFRKEREDADASAAASAADPAPTADSATAVPAAAVAQEDFEAKVAEAAAAKADELANARFAALQSKHDQMISELKATNESLKADLAKAAADAEALATSHAEALAKSAEDLAAANGEIASLRDQLKAEKEAHEAIVARALAPVAKPYASNRERIASGMRIR